MRHRYSCHWVNSLKGKSNAYLVPARPQEAAKLVRMVFLLVTRVIPPIQLVLVAPLLLAVVLQGLVEIPNRNIIYVNKKSY